MKTPLVPVQFPSIYKSASGQRSDVPKRMALATPDMQAALFAAADEVRAEGGEIFLSDLFRSYDMQFQAHLDYTSGKKSSFSPAPGGSLHEAGRSFDLDLDSLKIPLARFWEIAARHGLSPIINEPNPRLKEAWHFDCRGSHGKVYEYYAAGKANNRKPYAAMAASAILSAGLKHDDFQGREREGAIQAHLIKLGHEIGNLDGMLGMKSKSALEQAGILSGDLDAVLEALEHMVQKAFPREYQVPPTPGAIVPPAHVIS